MVVQSLELGSLEAFADAFLPAAAWVEREGNVTDWEGRSQPIHPVRGPAGVSRPDWEIFAGLAEAMGRPLGFGSLEALRAEAAALLEPRTVAARATAWTGTGPPKRLGELTLLSYPLLVDEGRLSEGADELKAALGEDRRSSRCIPRTPRSGARRRRPRRRATDAGEAVLPVRVTEHVAQGAVFVPFNQPGLARNGLLAGSFTTSARIEAAVAEAEPAVRGRRGGRLMDWLDWLLLVARVVVVFFALLILVMLVIWMERKVIADMQTRVGPMRAGPRGVLITLADGIKLFFKEGITPTLVDRPVYLVAPVIAMLPAFLAFAVIPFGTGVVLFGREVPFQIADLSIGILWILAMSSLMVYAIVLAGWSSGSNYPLLGSVRSSAQMISYEVGMALAIVAVVMYSDALRHVRRSSRARTGSGT